MYAAILPGAAYSFFGSSLQLAVGPTALLSLLTGQLVSNYNVLFGSEDAAAIGAQAALTIGLTLLILSFLNLGFLIRYVAQPVMSGFVTGAIMTIGFAQVKVYAPPTLLTKVIGFSLFLKL